MPLPASATAAAALRAAPVDHRQPSAGVLRRRHGRTAIRRQPDGTRHGRRGRRRGRAGVAALRLRPPRRGSGGAAHGLMNVLVSVPHGASAGNMLRTGLVQRLLDAAPDVEVVLASPLVDDVAFVQEFRHPRVHFEPLPPHRPAGLEARLMALIQASYVDAGVTEAVKIRRQEAIAKKTMRFIRAKRLLASVFLPSIVRQESRYDLIDRLVSHPGAEELFARYKPALLVVSSPGLIFAELPLLRTAARQGVPSMSVDASWDNFTNKVLPARRVSRLIVWNELMKQQAVQFHGYS